MHRQLMHTPGIGAVQLAQCANAFRQAPEVFQDDINQVCNYSDFGSQITTPRRGPLNLDAELSNLAKSHSNEMALLNYFSHFSPNGSNPADRLQATIPNAYWVGEVIAAGYVSVREVMVHFYW